MATVTKTKELLKISLREDAEYARAEDRVLALRARKSELERRRSELFEGLHREEQRRDVLTKRAEALIADDVVPLPSEVERAAMRRDLDAVEDEIAVVGRAIELQAASVNRERLRVSAVLCDRLRPRHLAIVKRLAAALGELSATLREEQALREAVADAGVITNGSDLRPMPFAFAGRLDESESAASMWMREAIEHGLLSEREAREYGLVGELPKWR
jgi:hypothetical protein